MNSDAIYKMIVETKQVSTWNKPRRDLRSLEATAQRILNSRVRGGKYAKILKVQTAASGVQMERTKARLRRTLQKEVSLWRSGLQEWGTLVKRSRDAFTDAYQQAYRLGLVATGHTVMRGPHGTNLSPTHTLNQSDQQWISSAVTEEMGYWMKFMKDIRYERGKMDLFKRLDMYVATLQSVYDAARVNGVAEYTLIHWVVGEAEHCPDCLWLQQQSPFHKDNLPTTPRSGGTRCLSNCKCQLIFDEISVDKWHTFKLRSTPRAKLSRELQRSRKLKFGLPLKRTGRKNAKKAKRN